MGGAVALVLLALLVAGLVLRQRKHRIDPQQQVGPA